MAVRDFLIRIRKHPAILMQICLAWQKHDRNQPATSQLKILQSQGNSAAAWQSIWVLTINGDQNFLLWHDRRSPHEALQSQNLPGNCHKVGMSYPINKQINNIRDSFTCNDGQVIPKPSKNAHTTEAIEFIMHQLDVPNHVVNVKEWLRLHKQTFSGWLGLLHHLSWVNWVIKFRLVQNKLY